MSKDNIPTFQSEELSLNNAEIPTLDTQTANQLLNNVFNACDMDPSSIPVEVLESWGNYKKPSFSLGRFFAYIFTILLVLLPLMFIHPTIIAERKNVKSATNAVYDIELKTLLPIRDASADLDGRPTQLTKNGSHSSFCRNHAEWHADNHRRICKWTDCHQNLSGKPSGYRQTGTG